MARIAGIVAFVPRSAAGRWFAILSSIAILSAAPGASAATVTFVHPLEGGQAVGSQPIEVTTDAQNVDRVEFSVDGVLAGVVRHPPYRIVFDFGSELSSRTISATLFSDHYREKSSATIRTAALTAGAHLDVDLVEVSLRITSSRVVHAGDLRLRENRIDQMIRSVLPNRGVAHFAFVVDRSLSMGDGRLDAALRAIDANLRRLRPGDSASLILFNHVVSPPRPIGEGARAAQRSDEVAPSGGTSLRDAVASATASGSVPAERTYTIVITDGRDRNSELTEEEALRKVSGTRSIISAIVLGSPGPFLEKATAKSGGLLVRASRATIGNSLAAVVDDINARYTVVYQSHGNPPGWRSIEVSPRGRGIRINASRKGYFAP
ncbi:MAG: VWA domain-containing protein [Thermoanaerobaculia bacterium]